MDEAALRELVRRVIRRQEIPNRRPDRTWGGPGTGISCAICDVPVRKEDMELEIEFAFDGDKPGFAVYHVHVPCFAMWELEQTIPKDGDPAH